MASAVCKLGALVLLVLLLCAPLSLADENELRDRATEEPSVRQLSAAVNTKRLANVLSDEFIGFSAKPQDIFDGQGNPICETSFLMAQSLGRTYLKVVADSSQLHLQTAAGRSVIGGPGDAGLVQIKASAWQAFYDWAHRAGVVPVFVLDYPTDGGTWDAKKTLQVLSAASALEIGQCRWQLGNGNVADGARYGEDLRTFRTMLKAFPKQQWGVVACELNPSGGVPLEEVQYFHANIDTLVDAVTLTKPLYGENRWNYSTLQREIHLRGLSKQRLPLWLDLVDMRHERQKSSDNERTCDGLCVREGLEYARTLGEAARSGVSTVFKSVHRDAIQQYTLNYLTALLYKRTVGNKVFAVQQRDLTEGRGEHADRRTSVYAYCTRNVTGSVTLVVVNEADSEPTNATIKLSTRALSSPVELFLVSVQNGQPMVNNRAFLDGTTVPQLVPVTAVTTLSAGVSFYVPAQTILFAVVPGVQVRECRTTGLPNWRAPAEPRELAHDRTSTDALLLDLIGELLEKGPLESLQRKRRAVAEDGSRHPRTLLAGGAKRKRFHPRFAGTAQDGGLEESLAQALEGSQSEFAPTERSARGPRQTQAYKRQQRRIRQKEKRVEKRNLLKMKHPLRESKRERAKRADQQLLMMRRARASPNHRFHERLLKRMSAKLASRKTKRSSLAEAVNEPPSFVGSDEDDSQRRSDFPLGDVHLVISKTAGGAGGEEADYVPADGDDEESASTEYRKLDRRPLRHRPGVRRRITISQRDFHRFAPARERVPVDSEEVDCAYRRGFRLGGRAMEGKETQRVDRYMPIRRERSEEDKDESNEKSDNVQADREAEESFSVAQTANTESVVRKLQEDSEEEVEGSSPNESSSEQQQHSLEESGEETHYEVTAPTRPVSDEVDLFTPAPRTSEERQIVPWLDQPQWSLESTSAEVAELLHRRYKRSEHPAAPLAESREVERLEDFFRTNAKLQQKFAEMFDLLLEAIEELESEENDAKEEVDDDGMVSENDANALHSRAKRNALLHPQSWESRERSNMIQRQQASVESVENLVVPVLRTGRANVASAAAAAQPAQDHEDENENENDHDALVEGAEGKPGAFVLRSVVNFMRRATSEFHQMFSGWFKKAS